jgi:hypothetical protein
MRKSWNATLGDCNQSPSSEAVDLPLIFDVEALRQLTTRSQLLACEVGFAARTDIVLAAMATRKADLQSSIFTNQVGNAARGRTTDSSRLHREASQNTLVRYCSRWKRSRVAS